mgnify:FL=1|jgi:hypothetical protein
MMLEQTYPTTKAELVRAIQMMKINKIKVIDGYVPSDERDLVKAAKHMMVGNHDLTIILVRS